MNPYSILAIILSIAISGGFGYYKGHASGKKEVKQEWDAEKATTAILHAQEVQKAREKETALQANADQLRRDKDNEIRSLNDRVAALNDSLRKRPNRPGGMSQTSGAGQGGCTGKELYRDDGEFLIRIARQADEVRLAYLQCFNQYQSLQ